MKFSGSYTSGLSSGSAPGAGNRFLGAAGRSDAVCVRIGKPPDLFEVSEDLQNNAVT